MSLAPRCAPWIAMLSRWDLRARHDGDQLRTGVPSSLLRQNRVVAWAILALAAFYEMVWAIGLKYTDGLTRLWLTIWTIAALAASPA